MNVCRCGHSVFRHYDENQANNCTACQCPEYRQQSVPDTVTIAQVDGDDDYQLRNITG